MKYAVDWVSAWLLALVFLFAGVDKLLHYTGFVTVLASGNVLPGALAPVLAPAVILSEIVIGTGLLFARTRRMAAIGGAGLLIAFLVVLATGALYGPPEVPCGCSFTLTLGESTALHIVFDVVLLVIAASLALASSRSEGATDPAPGLLDRPSEPRKEDA